MIREQTYNMITQEPTATDSEPSALLPTLLATVRDELRLHRQQRAARKQLVRDLATYTTPADLDDLEAVLDRYEEDQVADIRQILAEHRLSQHNAA